MHTKITANQVSVMSLLAGIMGSILVIKMQPLNLFIASIFLLLHVILDFVDGEVARFRNNSTLTGKYLDDVNHSITVPILLFFISFGVFGVFENILVLFLGCIAAVCEPVGQNVHWGYPYRILYSEILSLIDKRNGDESKEILQHEMHVEEGSFKGEMAQLLIRLRTWVLRTSIIQKLYEKIWLENRIVNIVILVGFLSPILSSFQYPNLSAKLLSLIIIIYGINRPIVLL
ncbi:MAG: CDP-alcohol phosphatidyltransferase family protein, partial [Mariniphaga sp.]|nr:CDP-alcohol phosphatidyltransferase family protein [Mariniphaga sp.]